MAAKKKPSKAQLDRARRIRRLIDGGAPSKPKSIKEQIQDRSGKG